VPLNKSFFWDIVFYLLFMTDKSSVFVEDITGLAVFSGEVIIFPYAFFFEIKNDSPQNFLPSKNIGFSSKLKKNTIKTIVSPIWGMVILGAGFSAFLFSERHLTNPLGHGIPLTYSILEEVKPRPKLNRLGIPYLPFASLSGSADIPPLGENTEENPGSLVSWDTESSRDSDTSSRLVRREEIAELNASILYSLQELNNKHALLNNGDVSPCRREILETQIDRLIITTRAELEEREALLNHQSDDGTSAGFEDSSPDLEDSDMEYREETISPEIGLAAPTQNAPAPAYRAIFEESREGPSNWDSRAESRAGASNSEAEP
jgi:hypothetical protein